MQIYESLQGLGSDFGLALGVFDGVHLGHQAVIAEARLGSGRVGVLTFHPHPVQILAPQKARRRILTSLPHQQHLMAKMGVDFMVVVPFTKKRAAQEAADFAAELFASGVRRVAVGEDWLFGRKRQGNLQKLQTWGAEKEVEVRGVAAVAADGVRISSTRIRTALDHDDFAGARRLLGRNFSVLGHVEKGRQLGRQLGFATANVVAGEEYLPPDGVHAVRGDWGAGWRIGVSNVGRRPTIEPGGRRLLEVHFLDADDVPDLYGREIEVAFVEKIREEQKFASLKELKNQIAADAERARTILQI